MATKPRPISHLMLGKKAARPEAVKLKLANYLDPKALPKLPTNFGHEDVIGTNAWGMLGNDNWGDCVLAGAGHETMLWNALGGHAVKITSENALSDYSAITGFDPKNPDSDQGTDMQQAASYRRKTGIVDAKGNRHKVVAYLAIEPGHLKQLYYATYLFGAAGIGIEFPASAMDQFNAGKPWTVVRNSPIDGGHYIPAVCKRSGKVSCITWAAQQPIAPAFLTKYMDEGIAYVTDEFLNSGKSPEGFDLQSLLADLKQVTKVA